MVQDFAKHPAAIAVDDIDALAEIANAKPTFRFGIKRGIKNAEIWD